MSADGASVLVSDEDAVLLEHPVAADVIRLLDGRSTAYDIARALEEVHRPELVHYALLALTRGGIVTEREPVPSATDSVSEPETPEAAALRRAWKGRADATHVRVRVAPGAGPEVEIVLTDDYLHPDLVRVGAGGKAILFACLGSSRVLLGPRLVPGKTACVACLQERMRMNLVARSLLHLPDDERDVRVEHIENAIPAGAYRVLADALRDHLADQLTHSLDAVLWSIPLGSGSRVPHAAARLPHCAACGDPTLSPRGADVVLRDRPRVPGSGGGYRTATPEETLARFAPLISPLTGVVRRVSKVPVEGTDLIHVYTASHGRSRGRGGMKSLKSDRRDPSGGKGRTDLDARVSALCEALERSSAVHRGTEPLRVARHSEIGRDAIHPNELLLFSDDQYRQRSELNRQDPSGFQWIPEPYQDEPIEWSPARSLLTGRVRWIPSALVYLGFDGEGRRFCKGDSNGLAGGNCLEEAILQGFLELVERDAVALWWYNRARVPGLDLDRADDSFVQRVRAYYRTLGRSLWALDLTTDLDIPCFAALSALDRASQQDIIFGFGAHLDPAIALSRAVTEVNQMLPTVLRTRAERRRQLLPDFEAAIQWWDTALVEAHPHLTPRPGGSIDVSTPSTSRRDLLGAVEHCVTRVRAVGSDVLVHDLTRTDIGLSVARVFAPGLRHFWARNARGRLYDVPVRLGWIQHARGEGELNPTAMFV